MKLEIQDAIKMINESANKDTEYSRELGIKFFFHWALLSGAAITLFMSFLTNDVVQMNISLDSMIYAHIAILGFFASLFISSIRNFIMMNAILNLAKSKFKIVKELSGLKSGEEYTSEPEDHWGAIRKALGYIVISCFLVGTISTYIFIIKTIM